MFYLADFLKIQAQKAASQIALRDFSEEVREFLQQNQVVRTSEITVSKRKPAISRNLALFYVGEDARVRAP